MAGSAGVPLAERLESAMHRTWSGRGALSTLLLPVAWSFEAGSALRRRLYGRGMRSIDRLPVPVIVVGNLIVGGAGKTPTVIAVVDLLRRHGYTPGIVSRGYGRFGDETVAVSSDASSERVGDEPLMLRRRTGASVVVGADRVAAGHALLSLDPAVDIVVSDDGLQHLGLDRDVEVLVFDERGAGNADDTPDWLHGPSLARGRGVSGRLVGGRHACRRFARGAARQGRRRRRRSRPARALLLDAARRRPASA